MDCKEISKSNSKTWTSLKGNRSRKRNAYPITVSWVAIVTLFLILGCLTLELNPFGSTVSGNLSTFDSTQQLGVSVTSDNSAVEFPPVDNINEDISDDSSNLSDVEKVEDTETLIPKLNFDLPLGDNFKNVTSLPSTTGNDQKSKNIGTEDMDSASFGSYIGNVPPSNASRDGSECDMYQGKWIHDCRGPLYTNNTCPVLSRSRNCQGNGRPDKDYENWRWQPENCELPRFDARKFLELMRGKTIAFYGDSLARNQMDSLMCMLWQVEVPKTRGSKQMPKYYFKSTSTTIVRIWSAWLVRHTMKPERLAPGVLKLHIDTPDDEIMRTFHNFDVIVLSSGHWFSKQLVYLLNNEVVGGQLWWPNKSKPMKINNKEAYRIAIETILTSLATHPSFTGLIILRSYSPNHYLGGEWNTGGSCDRSTTPLAAEERVENSHINRMHEIQATSFNRAVKKKTNQSKMIMMDITRVFEYRPDGHPSMYRKIDPNKTETQTQRPNGMPLPQDCLHWCMPGPVDTWNEFMFQLLRREFKDTTSLSL